VNRIRKILAAFLAITIMVIILVPCADGCDSNIHNEDTTYKNALEHHEEHNDICSPFCSCSCCSTQITVSPLTNFEIVKYIVSKTFVTIATPFHHTLYFSIWQPPKLS